MIIDDDQLDIVIILLLYTVQGFQHEFFEIKVDSYNGYQRRGGHFKNFMIPVQMRSTSSSCMPTQSGRLRQEPARDSATDSGPAVFIEPANIFSLCNGTG